jgi:hypothetical protein
MADTTLVLGGITFTALEVPASLPFGGEQHLAVHELVGGARQIDAMGRADRPIAWSGWFLGQTAVGRAKSVDALRIGGQQQTLTWSGFNYLVVVKSFEAEFQRFYQIPYRIVCEVVSDQTQPVTTPVSPPIDQAILVDANAAATAAVDLANAELTILMNAVTQAIEGVPLFSIASQSVINGVMDTVLAAQTQVGTLIAAQALAGATAGSFGGVIPGVPGSLSAVALTTQTSNVLDLGSLYGLQSILGRLNANLTSVNSGPNTLAVAGGNLYQIAEQQYGDATAWTAIAKANGLTDPFIQGSAILTIPPLSDQSGGILSN